jgi:hypothetical protein
VQAPTGELLSGGNFFINYPVGVVALPGTGNVSTGGTPPRVSGVSLPNLNDFNNGVRLTFLTSSPQPAFDPIISFDLCTGQTAPPPSAFSCVTESAADGNGTAFDPAVVVCTPQ